ncbi:MAG TPA: hypothetical protein VKP52_04530 [Pseudolabrys sp.]|nr:hypothetical protein [Pseudolabrys sp.]
MRSPPEYGTPTSPKLTDVEITPVRNLNVKHLLILFCRTDLYAWHGRQRESKSGAGYGPAVSN